MVNNHGYFCLMVLALLWGCPAQAQVFPVPSSRVGDVLEWRCDDAAAGGTTFMNASAGNNPACSATDTEITGAIRHALPLAGTLTGKHCDALTAPGDGNSWTMKLRVNGTTSETSTCVISGAAAVACDFSSQTPLAVAANAGATIAVVEAGAGVDGSTIKCSALYDY